LARAKNDGASLKAIAESHDARYEARAAAARAIGEMKAPPPSGVSAELVALSASTIAPAAAEKPYFYFARIAAAAQAQDLAVKIRLLRGAIAIDPDKPGVKADLIRAALTAKRWQLAVSTNSPSEHSYTGRPSDGDRNLNKGLAQAYEALGNLPQAQTYYRQAGEERDAKRVQAVEQRETQNALRRPVIKQDLEQDRLVRPRLTAANGGAR